MRRWERFALPLTASACLLAVWSLAVHVTATDIFPSPLAVAQGIGELFRRGILVSYVVDSMRRVAIGFALASLFAIPIGMLCGWSRSINAAVNPLVQALRPISPIAWMPLAVIWFGIGEAAPVFLIFLGGFFPLVLAANNGVRNVPEIHLRAAANFGLSTFATLRRVVFPAAVPNILIGLRISLGVSWLVLVAAEMIAVDSGLGYLIIDARNAGKRYDLVVAGMLLIGTIGLILDSSLRRLERARIFRWGFRG
ncbi:MAG TPA: ABC transporter permease [Thermoanaerobaculia bacterium]|nr:ABC transporter permease [Thermoanaerobaculia bacterium]